MAALSAFEANYQEMLAAWKSGHCVRIADETEQFSSDRVNKVASQVKTVKTRKSTGGKVEVLTQSWTIEWETMKGSWRETVIEAEDEKAAKRKLASKHKSVCLILAIHLT